MSFQMEIGLCGHLGQHVAYHVEVVVKPILENVTILSLIMEA